MALRKTASKKTTKKVAKKVTKKKTTTTKKAASGGRKKTTQAPASAPLVKVSGSSKASVGKKVPNFTAPATGDQTLSLKDFKGKNLVVYFYPKDSTPGCTREGQDFTELLPQFRRQNTEIVGVSRDSLRSHENFKAKQGYKFELLSDPDESLCELFGVMKMKNMYGRQVRGIERSTFLLDASGKLIKEWRGVKVPGHAEEVLEAVKEINSK